MSLVAFAELNDRFLYHYISFYMSQVKIVIELQFWYFTSYHFFCHKFLIISLVSFLATSFILFLLF